MSDIKLIMENWKRFLKEADDDDWSPEAHHDPRYRGVFGTMDDEAVAETIRTLTAKGRRPEEIRSALITQGAAKKDIDKALEQMPPLEEGAPLSPEDLLSQMDAEAEADILDAVESAQARGYDATNNGLEQVLQTLSVSGGPLRSELPILKLLIQSLLGNPEAVAKLKRKLDLGEVDPDAHAL